MNENWKSGVALFAVASASVSTGGSGRKVWNRERNLYFCPRVPLVLLPSKPRITSPDVPSVDRTPYRMDTFPPQYGRDRACHRRTMAIYRYVRWQSQAWRQRISSSEHFSRRSNRRSLSSSSHALDVCVTYRKQIHRMTHVGCYQTETIGINTLKQNRGFVRLLSVLSRHLHSILVQADIDWWSYWPVLGERSTVAWNAALRVI